MLAGTSHAGKGTVKTLCSLFALVILGSLPARAAPLPGSVLVEDPSGCIKKEPLIAELSALLDVSKDYRAYTLDVTTSAPGDDGSILVTVKVSGGESPVVRSLKITTIECADAARVVARIASQQLDGAPAAAAVTASPAAAPSTDRIPDEFIWFQRHVAVTLRSGRYGSSATVNEYEVPVVGPYRKELEWPDFYDKVGRPDLTSQLKANFAKRMVLWGLGVGGFVVGLMAGLAAIAAGTLATGLMYTANISTPLGKTGTTAAALVAGVGGGVLFILLGAGVGIGLITLQQMMPTHPVSGDEVRKLADEHNQKLGTAPSPEAFKDAAAAP